ncbi:MAG TPA: MoxR family ATPase [Solirubrobacteraceae bacterium]|nr:MoxR family ATPase [Solirubrobacteraceae bacterium]
MPSQRDAGAERRPDSPAGGQRLLHGVLEQLAPVVVGQEETVVLVLVALACRGHVLLQGVPGVAKTLLARALAATLGVRMRRVAFTPDMLPSDLTGTMTLRGGELAFRAGPVFTNVLLADEINRTPPKTQAALLEAMQEAQVTIDGEAHALPSPFLVLATQNPIEFEGTYPLPEAQLDRFLLQASVGYPSAEHELRMLELERVGVEPAGVRDVRAIAGAAEIEALVREAQSTAVAPEVAGYVVALVRATRELPSVQLGASPRAAVHLLAAAKAAARLRGRTFVTPDDVAALAPPVLGHRLLMTPEAELERFGAQEALRTVLAEVPVPR